MKLSKTLNIKHLSLAATLMVLLFFVSCTPSSSAPDYLTPSEAGNEGQLPSPSVNDELADAAWQKRIVFHVGPVDLAAGTKVQDALDAPLEMTFQTNEAVWVTGFEPKVVDSAGTELPSELLHQAIISNMHEENPLCSDAGSGNPLFIATSLLTGIELPQGYGYPLLPNDPIEAKIILANPTDQSYAGVYFELTLVARPINEFADLKDVKPMLLEMDACEHTPLEIEPGSFSEQTATYQVSKASKLVVAYAVLQDYGASVELTAGTDLEPFWTAGADLDEQHKIIQLSDNPYVDSGSVSFSAGDPLMVGITYDNTSDKWLKGATAGAMVYVAPTQ
ncbi:MAG: hypothetical protein ABH871_02910 [Pseudomonadota bacterium]